MAELSRRLFIGGSLIGIATGPVAARALEAEAEAPPAPTAEPEGAPPPLTSVPVQFELDGAETEGVVHPDDSALHHLRRSCGKTGIKEGCGAGTCGACTVVIDGIPQVTCLLPATALHRAKVTTVHGLGGSAPAAMHPVQRAFLAHDALQCGYCTPGFVVEAAAFHDQWRASRGTAEPTRDEVAAGLAGHLCRCGAYENLYAAVIAACQGRHDSAEGLQYERVDGPEKVTGEAVYTVDVALPDLHEGVVYRSPWGHARLQSLDVRAAAQIPGVAAVIRLVPDGAEVRYAGQEVAAVAAVDRRTAELAIAALAPMWEPLPAVTSMEAAQKPGAPSVYASKREAKAAPPASEGPVLPSGLHGNLRGPTSVSLLGKPRQGRKGVDEASRSGKVAAGTWRMGVQVHTTLEPHAAVARWNGTDAVELWVSTQSVTWLGEDVAQRYKLDKDAVTVHGRYVGGAFGAKAGLQIETVIALDLAREARKPVRVALSRPEELQVGGLRPGQQIELALGVGADGALLGLTQRAYGDSGVAVGHLAGFLTRITYDTPNKDLDEYDVVTNGPPGKPMRGPGGPAAFFALEGAVDEAAVLTGADPIALRRAWDPNAVRNHLYDWAEALPAWRDRGPAAAETGRYRRGTGLAIGAWFEFIDPNTQVELEAGPTGIVARCNTQDVGTGTASVLAATVAEALGLQPTDIRVEIGSNAGHIHGPASAGSRVTASVVPAAMDAAARLVAELQALAQDRGIAGEASASGMVGPSGTVPWTEVLAGASTVRVTGRRRRDDKAMVLPFAFYDTKVGRVFPGCVNVTTIEVDTRLGRTRVVEGWCGVGVGRIVRRALAENQIRGAFVQNVGLALYEERRLDPATGRLLTHNLDDYRLCGIGDSPPVTVHFEERGFEHVRGGAVGLGELGGVAVVGSIANAFRHATGRRPYRTPLTPKTALELLRSQA